MTKEIVQDGAPVLREKAKPVPEEMFGSDELKKLVTEMNEALDAFPEGVALAAPQIGVSWRLFIVRKDRTLPVNTQGSTLAQNSQGQTLKPEIEVYVNPEIVKTSRRKAKTHEGCLSVHDVYGATMRHQRVTIKARGSDGSPMQRGAGGLMAQIFEHEIDHLNGILFTDHAEQLVRLPAQTGIPHTGHTFIYFGTPRVASATLAFLMERGFVPALVVTSPDAPKGRGLAVTPSETKTFALAHDIPVITPEKLDAETVAMIGALKCDYAVVVAYGKLFPETLINAFPKGVLNVHYSLLPSYRGATPLETALLSGDSETGVTVQKMAKELDAGDILAQEATKIASTETARELRPRLIEMGARLLADTLPAYLQGATSPTAQDASRATRAHKIKKEDGLISLDAPAEENWHKYRAYADTIGTYFFENGKPRTTSDVVRGKRIKIIKASLKDGKFIIERVIPEGKREMTYIASRQLGESM